MKGFLKKTFLITAMLMAFTVTLLSCGKRVEYADLSPAEQMKEHLKFQKDSIQICTKDNYGAKTLIIEAFERGVSYSNKYKIKNIEVKYNDELKGWVGLINYKISNRNVYSEGSVKYHLFLWCETTGLAKDLKTYYKVYKVINSNNN